MDISSCEVERRDCLPVAPIRLKRPSEFEKIAHSRTVVV
jgi:hypothetical protein